MACLFLIRFCELDYTLSYFLNRLSKGLKKISVEQIKKLVIRWLSNSCSIKITENKLLESLW